MPRARSPAREGSWPARRILLTIDLTDAAAAAKQAQDRDHEEATTKPPRMSDETTPATVDATARQRIAEAERRRAGLKADEAGGT